MGCIRLPKFFGCRKSVPVDDEAEVVSRPGNLTGPTKPSRDKGKSRPTNGPDTNINVRAGPDGDVDDKVRPTCSFV